MGLKTTLACFCFSLMVAPIARCEEWASVKVLTEIPAESHGRMDVVEANLKLPAQWIKDKKFCLPKVKGECIVDTGIDGEAVLKACQKEKGRCVEYKFLVGIPTYYNGNKPLLKTPDEVVARDFQRSGQKLEVISTKSLSLKGIEAARERVVKYLEGSPVDSESVVLEAEIANKRALANLYIAESGLPTVNGEWAGPELEYSDWKLNDIHQRVIESMSLKFTDNSTARASERAKSKSKK